MKKPTSPEFKKTKGAILLGKIPATRAEIGARIGVSSVSVVYWVQGRNVPGDKYKELLRVAFEIPIESWGEELTEADLAQAAAAPSTVPELPVPEGIPGKVALLETLAIEIIEAIRSSSATPKERVSLLKDAVATLEKLSKITGEYNVERKILQLPRWKKIEAACEEALRPFPDAAKALQSALAKLDEAA